MPRILIIDDDEQMRIMMRQHLNRAGYETLEAADGRQGLELLKKTPADLIITDVIMPEKEGLETITESRRLWPGTKIIAISGGGRMGPTDYLPLARKLGAAQTLAKPFSRDELIDTVRRVLAPEKPPGA